MLGKKSLFNTESLELYATFDFQLIAYSVVTFLYFTVLNTG